MLLCLCLCLVLAACGGGSLPDGAKAELANDIAQHYGSVSWRVQSAEQATDPEYYLSSYFPDEMWCVVSPALVDPNDPLHRRQDHFLIAQSGADWYVPQAPAFSTRQDFRNVGCANG